MLTGEGASSAWAISAPLGLLGLAGAGLALRRGDGWRGRGLLVCAVVFGLLGAGTDHPRLAPMWPCTASPRRCGGSGGRCGMSSSSTSPGRRWGRRPCTPSPGRGRGERRWGWGWGRCCWRRWGWRGEGSRSSPGPRRWRCRRRCTPPSARRGSSEEVLLAPPLWPGLALAQQHLIDQRYHRKRLLGGHALWVDRLRPPAWDAFVAGNSFLAALQGLEQGLEQGGAAPVRGGGSGRAAGGRGAVVCGGSRALSAAIRRAGGAVPGAGGGAVRAAAQQRARGRGVAVGHARLGRADRRGGAGAVGVAGGGAAGRAGHLHHRAPVPQRCVLRWATASSACGPRGR